MTPYKHSFIVYGAVRGQSRPRFTRKGIAYKATEDRGAEAAVRAAFKESGGVSLKDKPLALQVVTHRTLPKSRPKKVKSEQDTFKPDASNILKLVEDALNGVAYNDDAQIVYSSCVKLPRVRQEKEYMEVFINEIV